MPKRQHQVTWADAGTESILNLMHRSKFRLLSETDLGNAFIPPTIIQEYRRAFTADVMRDISADLGLGQYRTPLSSERLIVVRKVIEAHLHVLK